MRTRNLLPTLLLPLLLLGCSSAAKTAPLQISQPLPDSETLSYSLLDSQDKPLGTAEVTINRQGGSLVLAQRYTDQQGHTDDGRVTVDAATLRPQSATREIQTADVHATEQTTYQGNTVSTVANDGTEHRHSATITNATYDDQESFFLMRAVNFSAGDVTNIALVVVDTAKGTISRAAASIRVQGKTTISVGGKSFDVWQVQLAGAGTSNTAWFEVAPGRRMLRYSNSRGTVLELMNP